MRVFTKYIVIALLVLCPFASAFGQKTISLRVMSMNIRQGGEYAGNKSEPYSEFINKYKPDVVALQEVDYKTTRNGKRDWLNEVAMQTGMFPYFCKSITYQGGYRRLCYSPPIYSCTPLPQQPRMRFFQSIRFSNVKRLSFLTRIHEKIALLVGFMFSCLVVRQSELVLCIFRLKLLSLQFSISQPSTRHSLLRIPLHRL